MGLPPSIHPTLSRFASLHRFALSPVPGPADPAGADGEGAPQLRRRLADRHGGAAQAEVPQGDHAHDPAAAGRRQGDDQRLQLGLAAKLAQAAVFHHR